MNIKKLYDEKSCRMIDVVPLEDYYSSLDLQRQEFQTKIDEMKNDILEILKRNLDVEDE